MGVERLDLGTEIVLVFDWRGGTLETAFSPGGSNQ